MTAIAAELTERATDVIFVPMTTPERAVDDYLDDLIRRDYPARTLDTYRRTLDQLCDHLQHRRGRIDVSQINTDDVRSFWARWTGRKKRGSGTYSANTRAGIEAHTNGFFEWLYQAEKIKRNPCDPIARTTRPREEDLDVVTVSSADVRKLLETAGVGCDPNPVHRVHTERLSVAIPAYIGPRRRAVANLRLHDYDRDRGLIRFREKGRKTIWKPVPGELAELLDAAIRAGAIPTEDDYLVPSLHAQRRPGDRDDRVIWRAVTEVAKRAGVKSHVHALRAAFAVFYLEQNPGDLEALQALMGHRSISTTQTYLRRLDRNLAMERVRTLSWGASGRGEIRTHGAPLGTQRLSKPPLSATQPPDRDAADSTRFAFEASPLPEPVVREPSFQANRQQQAEGNDPGLAGDLRDRIREDPASEGSRALR